MSRVEKKKNIKDLSFFISLTQALAQWSELRLLN